MITLFTMPKKWDPKFGPLQHRALKNWREKLGDVEIIMLGHDEGTSEAAREYKCINIPNVPVSEDGAPMLNDAFELATSKSKSRTLCYINTDILLTGPVDEAFDLLDTKKRPFLAIGERTGIDPAIIEEGDTELETLDKCRATNRYGIDYFVFSRGLYDDMPWFRLGRCWWDNYLVGRAIQLKADVIELSPMVMAVHQEHDYTHAGGYKAVWEGNDAKINELLFRNALLPKAKGTAHGIDDAPLIMVANSRGKLKIRKKPRK